MVYSPDSLEELDIESVDDLPALIGRPGVTWINVDGLGDVPLLQKLGAMFQLHRLMLEDIVHVHQRAKVEDFENHLFMVARMVSEDLRYPTEQISLVLGEGFLLSFQERVGDCLEPVRKRLRSNAGRIRRAGPDYLAYALIDTIVDHYFPVLEGLGERLETLEQKLLTDSNNGVASELHLMRSELSLLRKSIRPHRELVNSLSRDPWASITDDTRTYFRDCYDHSIQLVEIAETCREMCADLRDLHFSQISLRQNEVMKVLTITATLFIPLGFIAGVYGMNFDPDASPFNMPELGWFFGYPMAIGLMAAVAGGMLLFFRHRGWLGRDH